MPSNNAITALVESARGDSVTKNALTRENEMPPLVDFLTTEEQPHYIFSGAVADIIDNEQIIMTDSYDNNGESEKENTRKPNIGVSRKIPGRGLSITTVATDQRLLIIIPRCENKKEDHLDVSYSQMKAVHYEEVHNNRRLDIKKLEGGLRIDVSDSSPRTCESAVEYIRDRIDNRTTTDQENDPLSTIERLADLRDQSIITESEFCNKKEELLDRI